MSIVKVTHADRSKNNKPRVYFDGHNNWQDAVYVGQGIDVPKIGDTIDANTSSKNFNGSNVWFLNAWKPANGAAQQNSGGNSGTGIAPGSGAPAAPAPLKGWDIPTGDLSRFASNVVGQAITAGLIKTPSDVAGWTAAAYRAAEDLRSGKVRDFDDPAPTLEPVLQSFSGPDPEERHAYDDADFSDDIPF